MLATKLDPMRLTKKSQSDCIDDLENTSNRVLMPREKLLLHGAENLQDYELLAIFLRTGTKEQPIMEFSEFVLTEFGSLRALLRASLKEFTQIKGLGVAKYVQLQACCEMTKRYMAQQLAQPKSFTSSTSVRLYLQTVLENLEREVFVVLFLDTQHRLIKKEDMFLGSINSASVHPREIIKTALEYNAAALILAHNHPSGVSKPSHSDQEITAKIKQACVLFEIVLLDHFIVGKGEYYSFAENNLL